MTGSSTPGEAQVSDLTAQAHSLLMAQQDMHAAVVRMQSKAAMRRHFHEGLLAGMKLMLTDMPGAMMADEAIKAAEDYAEKNA